MAVNDVKKPVFNSHPAPAFALPIFIPERVDPSVTSYLNTDIYSSLIFKEAKVENQEDLDLIGVDTIPEIELISVILNVSKKKNVVVTEVQGRSGTVKEYISDGDFKLNARGFIVSEERTVAPVNDANWLQIMMSLRQPLEVAGGFLAIFGIETVVAMDFEISEIIGTRNQYSFRLNLETDTPIELTLADS